MQGDKIQSIPVKSSKEILEKLLDDTDVIGIDEVQFFDNSLVEIVSKIANNNRRVICAGLDMDFKGEPFGPMPKLMAIAEFVDKIQAVCMVCNNPATRTQRLINGRPAKKSDPVVLIGGAQESYEARCRKCHCVPR